ncbi:MAG TPA: PTS lactose/cellobiose transporter subunit IIA [Pseudoflavonifractor sp.]|jgi:PTS system cellobiose-specific IIA component|nr:PTS lactose/cellobiose transporter subunit IIA [Pseudoflavonifractor sp.]
MDSIMECMNMTAYGGEAKSKAMLAIQRAREGDFDGAAAALAESDEALAKSHAAHMALLSYDAANSDLRVTIFMVHAADHLSSAETVRALADEIIALHRR